MRYFFWLCLAFELIVLGSQSALGQEQPRGVARASDELGAEGLIITPESLLSAGHRYALCIGIDHYDSKCGYPALRCAVNDAKSLGGAFASLGYRTTVMTDDGSGFNAGGKPDPTLQPTSANIKRELAKFAQQAKYADDELVISYAGHGDIVDNQAAIVPIDYTRDSHNLVTVSEILKLLDDPQCRAGSKLLLLDACHSGKVDSSFLSNFMHEKSMLVFSACGAGQSSFEVAGAQHGRFTEVLLKGMVGEGFVPPASQPADNAPIAEWRGDAYPNASEFLTAQQLADYVGRAFDHNGWSRKTSGAAGASDDNPMGQNPQMFGKQDVTVPMIVARRKVSDPPPLTEEDRKVMEEILEKAKSSYAQRNWPEAIHYATTILRIDDKNWAALGIRGLANLHATYIAQAEADARAALKANTEEAEALDVVGICAAKRNDKAQAMSCLKAAAKLVEADPAKWPLLASGEDAAYRTLAMGVADPDGQESVDCLTKAAASPDLPPETVSDTAVVLGRKYESGDGVPQDCAKAMEWYQKGADEGNATAMLCAGVLYEDGPKGVHQDYGKAMECYHKAADVGNAAAIAHIGYLFEKAKGIAAANYDKAMTLYNTAADLGYAAAMTRLGFMCEHGEQVPPREDPDRAMTWYLKAADRRDATAMNNIGWLYFYGKGKTPQSYEKAMWWYRKGAELGSADAMTSIGYLYENGLGRPKDDKQAMYWYGKAADLKYAMAMDKIGAMYDHAQDYKQAMFWYQRAADLKNRQAIGGIGHLYDTGHGVLQNYTLALKYYLQAAEAGDAGDAGDAVTMYNIGRMCEEGHGVQRDYGKARDWYSRSSDAGYADAMAAIGELYENGHLGPQDYKQAMTCYLNAAKAGSPRGMFHMGQLCENGLAGTRDLNQARTWYHKAAELDDDDSKKWLAAHPGK